MVSNVRISLRGCPAGPGPMRPDTGAPSGPRLGPSRPQQRGWTTSSDSSGTAKADAPCLEFSRACFPGGVHQAVVLRGSRVRLVAGSPHQFEHRPVNARTVPALA
jgi:hypothetical protein